MEGTNLTLQLVALAGCPLILDLKLLASCKCKQLTDSIGTEVLGVFEELIIFPSREGLLCKASTDVSFLLFLVSFYSFWNSAWCLYLARWLDLIAVHVASC